MKVIIEIPGYMVGRLLCIISHYTEINNRFTTDDIFIACVNNEYGRIMKEKCTPITKIEDGGSNG